MPDIIKSKQLTKRIISSPHSVLYLLAIYFFIGSNVNAQDKEAIDKFSWLNISGFINNNIKHDSRQSVTAREGEVYLFPKPIVNDINGNDINDFGRLQMFNIHSRLKFGITGPEFKNFKTSGLLSFDFFGTQNDNISSARLRHAFINIKNDKVEFLLGHTWHPTFVTSCYPEILGWGAAVPVQPFNRGAQVRITYKPTSTLSLLTAFISQRDFANAGPNGTSGDYLRNAEIPEIQFRAINNFTDEFQMGFLTGYKTIAPRLQTNTGLAHKETISSYNIGGFAKYQNDRFFFKLHTIYGQNLSNLLLIGGYAVDEIDPVTDYRTYKNLHTHSTWTELEYKINDFSIGFFAAMLNAPDHKDVQNTEKYGLATNIESLYKIQPRVVYQKSKLKFGLEMGSTTAKYLADASSENLYDDHSVTNYRWIFTTTLSF